jgi:nitroimidazol reductase NimA-like FMN-containing flavoprotein (pyridoxamine 5'-phosphate oxidase superfamily)
MNTKPDEYRRSERSTIRRLPSRGAYDRETVYRILDEGVVCHVGLATKEGPVVIPMGYARRGDEILLHGSAKSRLLGEGHRGVEVAIAVTLLDGLVLARSGFHHSMNYRSAIVFGKTEPIEDPAEKRAALDALVEHMVPGRTRDARGASDGELEATKVIRVPIAEASAKIRTGPPVDESSDLELDIWAGVLPLERRPGTPIPDEHTREGTAVPEYVRNYAKQRG